jgi:hypothetical protein
MNQINRKVDVKDINVRRTFVMWKWSTEGIEASNALDWNSDDNTFEKRREGNSIVLKAHYKQCFKITRHE